jgi:hypothetical protein
MTISRTALAGLLLVLGLAATVPALAETAEEQARVLFREANQLFARKMYLDALAKYRRAQALYPSHKIDLNIGGTLDLLGRRTEAAFYFERFLAQSASAPADTVASARARLQQLRGKLGRVKVTTLLEGATILADGVSVGTAPLDLPVYLEPGTHRIEARKAGVTKSRHTVTVTAGQELALDLSLESPASTPATRAATSVPVRKVVPVPAKPPVVVPPPPKPEPDPMAKQRRKKTIWAWTSLAVGGACLITAAVLYGVAVPEGNDAYDAYRATKDKTKFASAWSDVESAQSKVVAGHVLMGVAAVGVGVSLYQFFSRPSVERRARLTITPLAAGAALHGSF